MAIYQFYLATIPKKGIAEFFGKIPHKLEVDFHKRTEDFLNNKIADNFDYLESIQHKCWSIAEIDSSEIIKELDQKLDRANWGNDKDSNNWKTKTEHVDNDAWVLTDEKKIQILEFTFRADLRQPQLKFLVEMIELAKKNEFLLMDRKGSLIEPEIKNVFELIMKSNALEFVKNPINFLTDLAEEKIKIE